MRRLTLIAVTALVALALGWYWVSPLWALDGFRDALDSGDRAKIAERVDFGALREQVRSEMGAHASLSLDLGGLGALTGSQSIVTAVATPDGLRRALAGQPNATNWSIDRLNLGTFRARTSDGVTPGLELVFHREGLSWNLVAVYGLAEWDASQKAAVARAAQEAVEIEDLVLDFPLSRQDRRTLPNGAEFFGASGSITNVGKVRRSVPVMLIVLRDGRDRIVYSWEVTPAKRQLAPGESVTVNESITDVPKSAKVAEFGWKGGLAFDGGPLIPIESSNEVR